MTKERLTLWVEENKDLLLLAAIAIGVLCAAVILLGHVPLHKVWTR